MPDFFEIDFLHMDAKKSGDAIALRYQLGSETRIHVVDGGYQVTGESLVAHLNKYFDSPSVVQAVVVTHPDSDHTGGLPTILEKFDVKQLWMLRPWLYADELLPKFAKFTSAANLANRLKEIYPPIVELEKIANKKGVQILEPFQGAQIGHFKVLSPKKSTYLNLIVASEKTPEPAASSVIKEFLESAAAFVSSVWGKEAFSSEETSAENNMSVIQYANLCGKKILLTGDAGRAALTEAADYAPVVGLSLPGIDRFQIPHHGSRRNVSTEILDRWLGKRLKERPADTVFQAIASSAKEDQDHPRKAVVRAMIHRGGSVFTSEKNTVCTSHGNPQRDGWSSATPRPYPEDQEQ